MIPHDILSQIFDRPPEDDNITWNDDVIEVINALFRRTHYSQVSLNLSQGVAYFYHDRTVVLKLAIEVQLKVITTASEPADDSDSPEVE